jgi:hypothetical protein
MKKFNVYFNLVVNGVVKEEVVTVDARSRVHALNFVSKNKPAGATITAVKLHKEGIKEIVPASVKDSEELRQGKQRFFDVHFEKVENGVAKRFYITVIAAHRNAALTIFTRKKIKGARLINVVRTYQIGLDPFEALGYN